MSHTPQRKEKDCLNCGTTVQGRYCHVCGQENVEPKETFWHMVVHFFNDLTHFDGSFFTSLKDLLFKPGFLSKEYMKGRRASYLHPVRMYVFTSAIFFLLFFSFFVSSKTIITNDNQPVSGEERTAYIKIIQQKLKKDTGSIFLKQQLSMALDTSRRLVSKDLLTVEPGKKNGVTFFDNEFTTFESYDSAQKTMPPSKRDGWVRRRLIKKDIDISKKFRDNPDEALKKFIESILHRLPYMLLISLPIFALLLKLVYIRRKQFYYADHAVFTIHLYVFTFLLLLLVFSLKALQDAVHWDFIDIIVILLFFLLFFYLYKAMRSFYGQRRGKTFLKFLLVSSLSLVMMVVLLVFIMFFSAATL